MGECKGEQVLVRTGVTSHPYMLERFRKLASQLRGTDKELMFSIDYSKEKEGSESAEYRRQVQLLDGIAPGNVYGFEGARLIEQYPQLDNMIKFNKGLAWSYHFESFSFVKTEYERRHNTTWNKCGIWTIEDDMGFTCDWNMILDSSFDGEQPRADLISSGLKHLTEHAATHNRFYSIASALFNTGFNARWHHDSFLMFLSKRLFLEVERHAQEGMHAFAECQVPTVCFEALAGGCKYRELNPDFIDRDGYFVIPTLMKHSPAQFRQHFEELSSQKECRLVHPLKF
uniref:Uncharacterized protein n=1 Tax=Lotharella globosa TaxID=91324 RepID=A0A7S4DX21_9EUKA|eukprot:CAMPEP_0167774500 /NCGR_PEP_ID=MMETSP0111_2-20121227/2034_1 /TAXON_ID=91324 /ORGANISM="Lotharella globosa, Strain CCCM811" /LENGTH=285 /DNA_ID=CAMNT_0007664303 /DNA_START=20 /DNA_END=877 /DNA_ORIENTATION=-